jgi:hypothetical protein
VFVDVFFIPSAHSLFLSLSLFSLLSSLFMGKQQGGHHISSSLPAAITNVRARAARGRPPSQHETNLYMYQQLTPCTNHQRAGHGKHEGGHQVSSSLPAAITNERARAARNHPHPGRATSSSRVFSRQVSATCIHT